MSKIRKIFSLSLLIFVAILLFGQLQPVQATAEVTTIGGARYYVDHVKEENELPYGVYQHTDISYASAAAGMCTSAAAGSGGGGAFVPDFYYPQQVNVLEIPSSTEIQIVPWSKMQQDKWNLATVKAMATNYEFLNPGYRVIAAINGDFFDINSTKPFPKTPSGAHVANGEFYKSISGNAVSFTNDGSTNTLIGDGAPTRTATMKLAVYDAEGNITNQFDINKINSAPGANEIAIYYANWAFEAGVAAQRLIPINVTDAIIVENGEYALPIATNDFYGLGTISKFGASELNAGDFAIVSNNPDVTALLQSGVKIRAQFEYTGKFAGAQNVVGVGQTILRDGALAGDDKNRHPRTMVGMKEDGTIIMTVVDGRQPNTNMYGATQTEMAAILAHYGCVDGYNLDGGGSSTMIILDDGEFRVMNSPSDGVERSDSNCILIVAKVPTIEFSADVTTESVTVNASVVDKKGVDFTDLYVKVGEEYKKVEDGKAVFTGLDPNTPVPYVFYGYKDGVYRELVLEGRTQTAKRLPELTLFELMVDDGDLYVYVAFEDPDLAVSRQFVKLGDISIAVSKGVAIFEDFEGNLMDTRISFSYDVVDGEGRIDQEYTPQRMRFGLTVFMNIALQETIDAIKSIYE